MTALRAILSDRALFLVALAFLSHGSFAAAFVPYRSLLGIEWFGFSDAAFAMIYAAGSALGLVCAIGVGLLNDRTGRRRNAARLAAGMGAAGALAVFVIDARWAFVVVHVLILPVGATLFSQLFTLARLAASVHPPGDRVAIQSGIRAVFAIPFIALLPILALALDDGMPLLNIYLFCGLAELLTLALFVFAWPRDGRTRWADAGSKLGIGQALAELAGPGITLRLGLLAMVLSGVHIYLILTGLVLSEGRATGDVALFAGAVAGLEIPVMMCLSAPLRRFGQGRLIMGAGFVHAGFLLAFPLLGGTSLVWALVVPAAIGAGVILTVPMAYLQDLMADRPGGGGALIAICNLVAQLLGAGLFALGTAIGGYPAAAWLTALTVASGGTLLVAADRRRAREIAA